jgi:hypothetical protein
MLRDRLAEIETLLDKRSFALARDLECFTTSPVTAYVKGAVLFADGSRLSMFEHFKERGDKLELTDYRALYPTGDRGTYS